MASDAAAELRFLARALRGAGGRDALAELRDGLGRAAGAAAEDARGTALAMPAPEGHERGLRRGIAATVQVSTALGATTARVTVSATGPERWPGAARVTEKGRWNHPVFGNRERWVTQYGPAGWFRAAVGRHQAEFDRAVGEVTDRIERRLAGEP